MSKVPLPEGVDNFEINGDDLERSFYVTFETTELSMEQILDFYRKHLEDNGWIDQFAGHEGVEGMLIYIRGREEFHVTAVDISGTLRLMVSYDHKEHTGDEFNTLVRQSSDSQALEAIGRFEKTYSELTSYRDSGTLEASYDDGNLTENAIFKTAFVSPNRFRFSYTESPDSFHSTSHVLTMEGETVKGMSSYDDQPENVDGIQLGIAGLYGVTSTTSGNVPQLLFPGYGASIHLAHLTLIEDSTTDDGVLCIRIQGTNLIGEEETWWIGKEDNLIRKIESRTDSKNWSVITYKPEANIEIKPEELEFTPPSR